MGDFLKVIWSVCPSDQDGQMHGRMPTGSSLCFSSLNPDTPQSASRQCSHPPPLWVEESICYHPALYVPELVIGSAQAIPGPVPGLQFGLLRML